jgi:hypothetical protein
MGPFLQRLLQPLQLNLQRYFAVAVSRGVTKNVSAYMQYREALRENPLIVFIAHDKDDEQMVRELLYNKLKAQVGIEPWLSEEKLKSIPLDKPEAWEPALQKALHESDCAMICLSKESISNKGYLYKKELPFILRTSKEQRELDTYVIVVKLEECATPRRFKRWDVSELFGADGYEKMLDTIVAAYAQLKKARRIEFKFQSPMP